MSDKQQTPPAAEKTAELPVAETAKPQEKQAEIGGPKGPDPTRYQDWERGGRCVDF